MTSFLQLHMLTFYPPSNLNRDDLGRPKTAVVGGVTRLRISSQALKRAWRTSAVFASALDGHLGIRTRRLGEAVMQRLIENGTDEVRALEIGREIAGAIGKIKDEGDKKPARTEEVIFISPAELQAAHAMAASMAAGQGGTASPESLLRRVDTAVDLAMFGRMVAKSPDHGREAAVQVSHAITTHATPVEDDYYVAVDDLNTRVEDAGAGFINEAGFGSGVYYTYLCIDRDLLTRNLDGDDNLARTAIAGLITAATTVSPSGKQASFASRARAHYVLAEKGDGQPRTLAGAFILPVKGDPMLHSVQHLRDWRKAMDTAYGPCAQSTSEMLVGEAGTLNDVITFSQMA